MSKYNKVNDFAAKDAINAPVVGTEFQLEFNAIEAAVNSKADSDNAVLTGVPVTPTPEGDTTNQIVNVEYVTEYTYDKKNTVSSNLSFPAPQAQINALQTNIIKDTTNQNSALKFSLGTSISFAFNNADRVTVTNSGLTASAITSQGTVTVLNGEVVLNGPGRVRGVDTVSDSRDAANKAYVDAVDAKVERIKQINQVGSLVFAFSDSSVDYGDTLGGNLLRAASVNSGGTFDAGSRLSGTWRCLGQVNSPANGTLFVRIS